MRLSLNTKSETAFKILNNPSKTPGYDKHPHESQTLPTANRHAKNSEHAIEFKLDTWDTFQPMKYFIPSVYCFFEGYMRLTRTNWSKAKEKTKVLQIAKFFSNRKTFHIWEL